MDMKDLDKIGLIRDSYQIDGITAAECRSIFLDWALKLPPEIDQLAAVRILRDHYIKMVPDHPMTAILEEGTAKIAKSGRRGGRAARVSSQ